MLFGAYYFVSDHMHEHYRLVYDILALLSEFGGISASFLKMSLTLGFFLNSRVHIENLINENYLLKLSDKKDNSD